MTDERHGKGQAEWDAGVSGASGHLLQSWGWGDFKSEFGWSVDRVSASHRGNVGLAQILYRTKGPVSVGYIPRGPALGSSDPELVHSLMRAVDSSARERRALYTIVEPDTPLPLGGSYRQHGFVQGPEHVQPGRTVKIPLLEDEALLKQMNQNTRYSVRLALRRGVQVVRNGDRYGVDDFYALLTDTAARNRFHVHSRDYYARFLSMFGDDALCIFAEADGNLAAGLISARFGDEAIYMYGASSSEHRGHGAAFLLQFEAMRWARGAGCARYDLWGIPMVDPDSVTDTGDTIAGTKGDDWRGLYRFKTGFGGEIVSYPPTLERRYNLVGSFVARRLLGQQRGDS